MSRLPTEVAANPHAVSVVVAGMVAGWIAEAVAERGTAVVAFSGGRTPAAMLGRLAALRLPWDAVHVAQVDERVAADGHTDRNWTMLSERLLDPAGVPAGNRHPMPVTASDLDAAAEAYAAELQVLCGGVLDVVHLGLGADGHTASLVPGDPVLEVAGADVAATVEYQGRRRMTLAYPALDRARRIVWEVVGGDKSEAVRVLLQGGDSPAARVSPERAVLVADAAAAG